MKPLLQAELVNPPFEDPVLYLDFLFARRALLFDCGNLRRLSTRKLLRVSDVFVSHTHMDHFADFDWLLRLLVGRAKLLRLYGPEGFIERVAHKLAAYTWNLVHNYGDNLVLEVVELHAGERGLRTSYSCREGFRDSGSTPCDLPGGLLIDEPGFRVRAAVLDHGIPVLAYAVEETRHVNVWKNRLAALGLPVGSWLRTLKDQVLRDAPDTAPVDVQWQEDGRRIERRFTLGDLKREVLRLVPGQRIGYVVDAAGHEANAEQIVRLVEGVDLLFIETPFLDEDRRHAEQRHHLTARRAGEIARRAGARRVEPCHFSPRYSERERELRDELRAAAVVASPW